MNNWTGIGRLTKDPMISYISSSQTCVAKFTMAIDDGYGENKKTNFIPVTVFGKTAENCEKFLAKGRLVGVQGRIQTGSYEKNGQKVFTTDVVADRVEFLEWGEKKADEVPSGFERITDDDTPF